MASLPGLSLESKLYNAVYNSLKYDYLCINRKPP